jgi:serine/threonine-protein phosphatase 2A regulatory subunit B
MAWLRARNSAQYVLTTNCNTIKIWKFIYKQIKKVVRPSTKDLSLPKLQIVE